MANEVAIIETRATQLAEKIEILVTEARKKVASVANTAQVYTYYEIGRYIIEDEQGGKLRAEYGKGILKRVSEQLTERLGKGWSVDTLEKTRRFFLVYSKSKTVVWKSDVNMENSATSQWKLLEDKNSATSQRKLLEDKKSATVQRKFNVEKNITTGYKHPQFVLSWNHYQILTHGTIGKVCRISKSGNYAVKNMIIFKPHDAIHSCFLHRFLTDYNTQMDFLQQAAGTSQKFVSLSFIRNTLIFRPSDTILNLFYNHSEKYFNYVQSLQSQLRLLTEARDRLLPKLMSGAIEV